MQTIVVGDCEWHTVPGNYVTTAVATWASHYYWPCNACGTNCVYGDGVRVVACVKYYNF